MADESSNQQSCGGKKRAMLAYGVIQISATVVSALSLAAIAIGLYSRHSFALGFVVAPALFALQYVPFCSPTMNDFTFHSTSRRRLCVLLSSCSLSACLLSRTRQDPDNQ